MKELFQVNINLLESGACLTSPSLEVLRKARSPMTLGLINLLVETRTDWTPEVSEPRTAQNYSIMIQASNESRFAHTEKRKHLTFHSTSKKDGCASLGKQHLTELLTERQLLLLGKGSARVRGYG